MPLTWECLTTCCWQLGEPDGLEGFVVGGAVRGWSGWWILD